MILWQNKNTIIFLNFYEMKTFFLYLPALLAIFYTKGIYL